jgi:uncharacterized protein (DUF736 family)
VTIEYQIGVERLEEKVNAVAERNATQYQPHIDHLRDLLQKKHTHELLIDYDPDDEDSICMFSQWTLEHTVMKTQCVERYLRYMRDHNTGLEGSWSELMCAQRAADESYGMAKSGRTVMQYYKSEYCPSEGHFLADERGSYVRDTWVSCFLAQHDLVLDLKLIIRNNLRHVSLKKVAGYISDILARPVSDALCAQLAASEAAVAASGGTTIIPYSNRYDVQPEWAVGNSDLRLYFWKRYRLRWPVTVGHAVWTIAHSEEIDMKWQTRGKTYMTDVHERAAKDRDEVFLPQDALYELLQYKWVQLTPPEAEKLIAAHELTNPNARRDLEPHQVKVQGRSRLIDAVEFNVNSSSAFDNFIASSDMGGNLSYRRPCDARPVIAFSQDEKVYHTHEYTAFCWALASKTPIDKKSRGSALHISGWSSRAAKIAFGFLLDAEVLARINEHRAGKEYPVTASGVDVGAAWIKVQEQAGTPSPTRAMPPLSLNIPAGLWGNTSDACAVGCWLMAPGSGKDGWCVETLLI